MSQNHLSLIQALMRPEAFPHQVENIELIETHISWVLLTGKYAYKIKKPINLGFYDARDLKQRISFCEEELRLNRRLAPDLYIGLTRVIGPTSSAHIEEHNKYFDNKVTYRQIDIAVKMVEFPQGKLLSTISSNQSIEDEAFNQLGKRLGEFHLNLKECNNKDNSFKINEVIEPMLNNLAIIETLDMNEEDAKWIVKYKQWIKNELIRLKEILKERSLNKVKRECHGDLHAGNIHIKNNRTLQVFDAIDFNPKLRWIDPINEISFLVMDLEVRGYNIQARQLLNEWLESTGDYCGMSLFRIYSIYRALVRAKVYAIKTKQIYKSKEKLEGKELDLARKEVSIYINKAKEIKCLIPKALIIMNGFSGSGKSYLSERISKDILAIRIRSDIERKRLFKSFINKHYQQESYKPYNINPIPITSRINLYSKELTHWLFNIWLPCITQRCLSGGQTTIVDATFLKRNERNIMLNLAKSMRVPFAILTCECSDLNAKRRIKERELNTSDPSDASFDVRKRQKEYIEELSQEELLFNLKFNEEKSYRNTIKELSFLIESQRNKIITNAQFY